MATEQTPLLPPGDASSSSNGQRRMAASSVGERLPYNDYATIDWLRDLVRDSYRYRYIHSRKGLRYALVAAFDSCSGWIAVAVIGSITACIAFVVDVAEATVSDWKLGYCTTNPFLSRDACCAPTDHAGDCHAFRPWSATYWFSFAIYVVAALAFGVVSSSATMLTKRSLPVVDHNTSLRPLPSGKTIYMAAGSGIPEIKTILSGFVIPNFLDLKVLLVKAFGATFAVATGMCLGKEGPFVHISTCVGYLVCRCFPKYRDNGRKMREMLSAACASGLSVAFGAPIGGVLFSYEEISTYFPRKVLWRAFLCSLFASMILKALNPNGTGKLVLFETNYGTSYEAIHYLVFIALGIAGGLFGGIFCKANFKWSRWFRQLPLIKSYPVFEVFLVALATALLQFPNPLTRDSGDVIVRNLLVSCRDAESSTSFVCRNEARTDGKGDYIAWLIHGSAIKLILTIITFGTKVPSGVIIPALDGGAFFGRLIGQCMASTSPGIFAMVGAAAFLAGVSRMTISLCVIMFELTGELEYIVPHMIAILVAKWIADAISSEGVYDLAQTILGHPFLDNDHALKLVQAYGTSPKSAASLSPSYNRDANPALVEVLIPPARTMEEITVEVPSSNTVPSSVLERKLGQLHDRGLMDAGLVLVRNGMLQGYLPEAELEHGMRGLGLTSSGDAEVRLLGPIVESRHDEEGVDCSREQIGVLDLSAFVDRTPLTLCSKAPLEYAVEMFGKLGLRFLCVTEEGTGKLLGVVIKKRLVAYLETLHPQE
ncbi:chloride channel protein [Diplodia corticola]|uniref:Chloride channel protein n=1 Tax=Diplodia corticola TaxID=236234 RepID=A0A1J9SAR4_9PEZI|nr:chloride channel protein [Diplodia corticola]OJD37583.1 chloride channel protein [Diplodia corticola]